MSNYLLVELNLNDISLSEERFPNKEQNKFIYEHLRYYYSKLEWVPPIEINVCSESIFVIRGQLYF